MRAKGEKHWLREWEDRLTADQLDRAISMVHAAGWPYGSRPPEFVWADAFARVSLPAGGAGDAEKEERRQDGDGRSAGSRA